MTQSELSIDLLEKCISEIRVWMAKNVLKFNDYKTEYILFGSQQQLEKIPSRRVSIGNFCTKNTTQVRNLVILDSNMTMTAHISKITSASSYHLRNIRGIRKYLNRAAAEQLVHAFVSSRLDMCCMFPDGICVLVIRCFYINLSLTTHGETEISPLLLLVYGMLYRAL
ncbi:uncharacterized protein [Antedon mediterranea]|uniref:uncharacterized protein n=1 Tax=Antedon mediterranea TaxID=105859 RepID=UPI003AF79976